MNTRNKLTALTIFIALTVSACGGGPSETETALADQNEALQAQIDELADQIGETNTPAEEPSNTIEVVATTAAPAPVEEEPVAETTVAPTTAAPAVVEEEPTVETEDTTAATPAPTPPEAVDGYAVPSGTQLTGQLGPDEISGILEDVIGTTDNIAGDLSRLTPFPAVSTMPNTEVYKVILSASASSGDVELTETINFVTTAEPLDVTSTYQAEFASLGYGPISTSSTERDGITFFVAKAGPYDVVSYSNEGRTEVELGYSSFLDDNATNDFDQLFAGVAKASPTVENSEFKRASASHIFGTGSIQLDTATTMTGEELTSTFDARTSPLGWTVDRAINDEIVEYKAPGNSSKAKVSVADISGTWRQTVEFLYN